MYKNSIIHCLPLCGSVLLPPERHHRFIVILDFCPWHLWVAISVMAPRESWILVFMPLESLPFVCRWIEWLVTKSDGTRCHTQVTKDYFFHLAGSPCVAICLLSLMMHVSMLQAILWRGPWDRESRKTSNQQPVRSWIVQQPRRHELLTTITWVSLEAGPLPVKP